MADLKYIILRGPVNENVTRKDIAEKLGVSVSVVSRVINNSGYVSKEKEKKY